MATRISFLRIINRLFNVTVLWTIYCLLICIYFYRCLSTVGREDSIDGVHVIYLGLGCISFGTVMHEIGHAVGFYHEQQRYDRDKFVRILYGNIMLDSKDQYTNEEEITSMGYAYDFNSIMHYHAHAFSKSGKLVTKVRKPYRPLKPKLGQRQVLSYLDIAQVRAMYQCNRLPSLESVKTCVSKKTKGRDYRGKLDYTEKGVMCQPWDEQYPHQHKFDVKNKDDDLKSNYCRNPGGVNERPWCFTTYGKEMKQDWQYCDLTFCEDK
ncbi:hepatocyte growth factor-like [Hydractinia symbiolongicarpus]|uniref:hepatocyte growth factor-like n=1 Tax=Hydractinia symbiolongicarpus TaxID=13093 RepID=UPI00254FE25C|nr:hepatocyte growth factor-like [Hydractinia symbiolongicarpus]